MIYTLLIIAVIMTFWQFTRDSNNCSFGVCLTANLIVAVLYAGFLWLFSGPGVFGTLNIDWTGANATGVPPGVSAWALFIGLWLLSIFTDLARGKISEGKELAYAAVGAITTPILWAVIFVVLQFFGVVTVKWC
jgi:hypothetical protein